MNACLRVLGVGLIAAHGDLVVAGEDRRGYGFGCEAESGEAQGEQGWDGEVHFESVVNSMSLVELEEWMFMLR